MALSPVEWAICRVEPDDYEDYVQGQDDLTPGWLDYEYQEAPQPGVDRRCPECRGTCVVRGTDDPCPGCFGEGIV